MNLSLDLEALQMRRNRIRLLLLIVFAYILLSFLMVNRTSSTKSEKEYTLAEEEEADEKFWQSVGAGGGITGPAALANEKLQLQQSSS